MSAGVGVPNANAGPGVAEIHTEDGPSMDATTATPRQQQVVQLEAARGLDVVIGLLESIDRRLAHLEEHHTGYST